jgi:hypothetical protein
MNVDKFDVKLKTLNNKQTNSDSKDLVGTWKAVTLFTLAVQRRLL